MNHCVIEGELCSKCCEVLTVKESKNFRHWMKYVRRYGLTYDQDKAYSIMRKITKRRAKKKNKFLVNRVGNEQSYFVCKNYVDGKCQDYKNRPDMCRDYPNYSSTEEAWKKWVLESDNLIGLYRPDCTYYDKKYFTDEVALQNTTC